MKKLLPIIFLFALSVWVFAQTDLPIIGKIADIKTFNKVYLSAPSTQDRNFMIKMLKKEKSKLEIVDDPKDAEFFLEYREVARQEKSGLLNIGRDYTETGEMSAYFYNADKKKVIAWSKTKVYYESSGMPTSSPNSYDLTGKFLDAWKKK